MERVETMMETGIGNLGVAAMIAGYAASDDVIVDVSNVKVDFFKSNKERLENFISWLLNEKGCAERTFSVHLSFKDTSPLTQQRFECSTIELSTPALARERLHCLALSGGLDSLSSFIALKDHKITPLCCFVDYGQAQLEYERTSLAACKRKLKIPTVGFTIDLGDVSPKTNTGWPIGGFKIPARNFTILALMDRFIDVDRSVEGPRSLNFGVYAGEIMDKNHDKSRRFFDECTSIFSEYNGVKTVIHSPVAHMSKVEQLRFLEKHHILDFALANCRTCTSATKEPCLDCKPCFNRMLSVYRAGFGDRVRPGQWNGLARSNIVKEYESHVDDYTGERKDDIQKFLAFLVDSLYESG